MAWGYERGFVIEHDDTLKKRIDCKSCYHYDKNDRSCMKKPLYLPVDGYNCWKKCEFFRLDKNTPNYETKKKYVSGKRLAEINKILALPKCERPYNYKKNDRVSLLKGGFTLVRGRVIDKNIKVRKVMLEIVISTGEKKHIGMLCDYDNKIVYLAKGYTDEAGEIIAEMIE